MTLQPDAPASASRHHTTAELVAIRRQDGRLYRPRKLVACAVVDGDDLLSGVIVFGTHSPEIAQPLADSYVAWQIDAGYKAGPAAGGGWWRDGFEGGRRVWLTDEVRGRAGVMFDRIVEAPIAAGRDAGGEQDA